MAIEQGLFTKMGDLALNDQYYDAVKPLSTPVNSFEVLDQGIVAVYFGLRKDMGILYKDPTWPIVMEGLDSVPNEVLGLARALFDVQVRLARGASNAEQRKHDRVRQSRFGNRLSRLGRGDVVRAMGGVWELPLVLSRMTQN